MQQDVQVGVIEPEKAGGVSTMDAMKSWNKNQVCAQLSN